METLTGVLEAVSRPLASRTPASSYLSDDDFARLLGVRNLTELRKRVGFGSKQQILEFPINPL
jgi:hypothetical protein